MPYIEILWDQNPLYCHSFCTDRPLSVLWCTRVQVNSQPAVGLFFLPCPLLPAK